MCMQIDIDTVTRQFNHDHRPECSKHNAFGELALHLETLSQDNLSAKSMHANIYQSRKVQNSHCSASCADAYSLARRFNSSFIATFMRQPTNPPRNAVGAAVRDPSFMVIKRIRPLIFWNEYNRVCSGHMSALKNKNQGYAHTTRMQGASKETLK
jgi:hypothetical protein